jgi:hypothetical protein
VDRRPRSPFCLSSKKATRARVAPAWLRPGEENEDMGKGSERLAPNHKALIRKSAISSEIAEARGYRTVDSPQLLKMRGFNNRQVKLVPCLLIPIWDVFGKNERVQIRPDKPWKDRASGKEQKYENPPGVGVTLDVNPKVRRKVLNAQRALFITEGIRKGDSLASKGQAAIALYGVWNWRGADESGAVTALADWERIPLEGRPVYIVFDSDVMTKPSVQKALERLGKWLERRGARNRYVYLPPGPDGEKQGVDDFFASEGTVEELISLSTEKIRGLPQIFASGSQLRDHTREVIQTLEKANDPPQMFRWATRLARVIIDEKGRAVTDPFALESLRGRMSQVANYYTVRGDKKIDVYPPKDLAASVLALGPEDWPFPVLEGIVECPTLRPDGTILDHPGYDLATGLQYIPHADLEMPIIPEKPSSKQIKWSIGTLEEALRDFPFVSQADKANTLGFWLTPVVRSAIDAPVPLALITAPQAGTGKSTIADLGSIIATGRPAEMGTAPKEADEFRKQITTSLVRSPSLIVFDNLMGRLSSDQLSRALTARVWKDRILRTNEEAILPVRTAWAATGNNIILGGDLPRRSFPIKLDADQAKPWRRSGWSHEDIYGWAMEERGNLLLALLVLARSWWSAGCPGSGTRKALMSYQEWQRVVGGILDHAGIEGFLDNLDEMYNTMDIETEQWGPFLAAWRQELGKKAVRLGQVVNRLDADLIPDDVEGAKNRDSLVRLLGHQIRYRMDRWFPFGDAEYRLVRDQTGGHGGWRVEMRRRP